MIPMSLKRSGGRSGLDSTTVRGMMGSARCFAEVPVTAAEAEAGRGDLVLPGGVRVVIDPETGELCVKVGRPAASRSATHSPFLRGVDPAAAASADSSGGKSVCICFSSEVLAARSSARLESPRGRFFGGCADSIAPAGRAPHRQREGPGGRRLAAVEAAAVPS